MRRPEIRVAQRASRTMQREWSRIHARRAFDRQRWLLAPKAPPPSLNSFKTSVLANVALTVVSVLPVLAALLLGAAYLWSSACVAEVGGGSGGGAGRRGGVARLHPAIDGGATGQASLEGGRKLGFSSCKFRQRGFGQSEG